MEIRAIGSLADFEAANILIDAMSKWDAEQSRKFCVTDGELMQYVYGDTPEKLMQKFSQPNARFFLAQVEEHALGCAGYSKSDDGMPNCKKCSYDRKRAARALPKA